MPYVIVADMKTLKIQPRLQVVPPKRCRTKRVRAVPRVFYEGFFEQLSHKLGIKTGKMIFNWMAIIYGMILQRLSARNTLRTGGGFDSRSGEDIGPQTSQRENSFE